jgi:NTE family protein
LTGPVGLALGGGSARGWSHIGVVRALETAGLRPDIVCGTSIGAVVGAAYVNGKLDALEAFARSLTWQRVVGFLDLSLAGGLIHGERVTEYFREKFADSTIESLPRPFGAVACDLRTGREVWLRDGPVADAVRASMAVPGVFRPVPRGDMLLADGGLVDPVPVALARAMGARVVIAVDLGSDLVGRHLAGNDNHGRPPDARPGHRHESVIARLQSGLAALGERLLPEDEPEQPSLLDVLLASLNVMQVRITRSRLSEEPPDVLVQPRVAELALMDFHRAAEAIEEGARAVERVADALRALPPGH